MEHGKTTELYLTTNWVVLARMQIILIKKKANNIIYVTYIIGHLMKMCYWFLRLLTFLIFQINSKNILVVLNVLSLIDNKAINRRFQLYKKKYFFGVFIIKDKKEKNYQKNVFLI